MTTLSKKTLLKNNIGLLEIDEIFSRIPEWNKYFISNYGRLIRLKNDGTYNIVNPSISTGGYLTYTLSKPARKYNGRKVKNEYGYSRGERTCKNAHQLVAQVFVKSNYPAEYNIKDLQVHHKDKDRKNNYYKNLMYLCARKNGRNDHEFIHTLKKVAYYNKDKDSFYTYRDMDLLLKRLDVSILEFIDSIKYTDKLFTSQNGKWDVYFINGHFIGIQFYSSSNPSKH